MQALSNIKESFSAIGNSENIFQYQKFFDIGQYLPLSNFWYPEIAIFSDVEFALQILEWNDLNLNLESLAEFQIHVSETKSLLLSKKKLK